MVTHLAPGSVGEWGPEHIYAADVLVFIPTASPVCLPQWLQVGCLQKPLTLKSLTLKITIDFDNSTQDS